MAGTKKIIRPMTGLRLTPEQRAKAAAYNGSINHGDPAFALSTIKQLEAFAKAYSLN